MVLEAGLEFFLLDVFGRKIQGAGAELEQFADQFGDLLHAEFVEVRSEIRRAVFKGFACQKYAGKTLGLDTDIDERRFLVFQHHVVARLMLFDERVFQQQRVVLRLDDRELDVAGMAHEHFCLGELVFLFPEIGCQPVAKILGLAHIQDLSLRIHVFVDAWSDRDGRRRNFEIVVRHDKP